jgi:hypothetical protein
VLAPTRELAAQIKAEAVKLLQPHGSNIGVQVGHQILALTCGSSACLSAKARAYSRVELNCNAAAVTAVAAKRQHPQPGAQRMKPLNV